MKTKRKQITNNFLLYFILIFCFEPKLFVKYKFLNWTYIVGLLFAFCLICFIYLKEKTPIPMMFYWVVLFRVSFMLQTFLAKGDVTMWGYFTIVLFTLCLTSSYYIKKDCNFFLNALINVLTVILTINLIITFIYPNGIIDELYFIGIRTRCTDLIFPLIVITFVRDNLNKVKASPKSLYCLIISIATVYRLHIATAIVGLGCFVIFLGVFYFILKSLRGIKLMPILLVGALLLSGLVVSGILIKSFSWLIQNVLHKSATISGRTEIWELAIEKIKEKPIFGHGMYNNGNFVYWGYTGGEKSLWQAHNQWLQLLFDGGIVTTVIFIALIIVSGNRLEKIKNKTVKTLFLAGFGAFFVMMISEIYSYTQYFYLLIFIAYQGKNLKGKDCFEDRISCNLQQ